MNKYRNIKTAVDGFTFDSQKEAARYVQLKLLQKASEIRGLELQPKFDLVVNDVKIGKYIGDFVYIENGKKIVEDCKGMKTPVYRIKKKLMKAIYGIDILET